MEYAVFETGSKQYRVVKGQVINVENVESDKDSVLFDKVLLYVNDSKVDIGKPYVAKFSIKAKVLENIRGKKVRAARFKAKARERRVVGYRHAISRIQIEAFSQGK